MKRKLILIIAVMLAVSLFACDMGGSVSETLSTASVPTEESEMSTHTSVPTEESKMNTHITVPSEVNDPINSDDYLVTVKYGGGNAVPVPCFGATVGISSVTVEGEGKIENDRMSFCYFDCDFSSPVTVSVKPSFEFTECKVRPESEAITAAPDADGSISFTLTEPCKLSVEFDGEIYTNLFIYANAPEKEQLTSADRDVIYFGPGVHDAGKIELKSNQTLYLASGAVVYGYVVADNASDIAIKGRGILCGSKLDHKMNAARYNLCNIERCNNVTIQGVIFVDSPTWTLRLNACENVDIDNFKEICWFYNSDGIDVCGCTDVSVTDSMLRNYDDNISIKAFDSRDSKSLLFKDCIFWADCAHNMLVGPEARDAEYENVFSDITFENITVLEQKQAGDFYKGVMAITCADNAVYDGITWKNIVIERMTDGAVINFRFSNDYATYFGKSVDNVTIENVVCKAAPTRGDVIIGREETPLGGITITDYTIGGTKVTHDTDNFTNINYVNSLTIDGVEKKYPEQSEEKPDSFVRVVSDSSANSTIMKTFESGTFTAGVRYTIEAKARFSGIDNTKGSNPSAGLSYVNLYLYDNAGALSSFSDFASCLNGDSDWSTYSYSFSVAQNAGSTTVGIGFWDAVGTVEVAWVVITDADGKEVFRDDFDTLDEETWHIIAAGEFIGIAE